MLAAHGDLRLRIFTTCPPSDARTSGAYLRQVQQTARWSEEAGCEGILVYTDVPTSPEELRDIGVVFGIVRDRVAA
jgi:hypothetical protein